MEFQSTQPIAKIAVYLDAENDKMESVKVDRLFLEGMAVDHQVETIRFRFAWGGYDSTGKFHKALALGASDRSIQSNVKCNVCTSGQKDKPCDKGCEAHIFRSCARNEQGNPIQDHGEAFVSKVLLDHGKLEDILRGGWQFKEPIELMYQGKSVWKG